MIRSPEDTTKIIDLLTRVKQVSEIYCKANNSQKDRLFQKALFLVDQLVDLGYDRDFSESLLMFGPEFLSIPSMISNELYRSKYPEAYEVML